MGNTLDTSEDELLRLMEGLCDCPAGYTNASHFLTESNVGKALASRCTENPIIVACDVLDSLFPIPAITEVTAAIRPYCDNGSSERDRDAFLLTTTGWILNAISSIDELPQLLRDRAKRARRALFANPTGIIVFDDNVGGGGSRFPANAQDEGLSWH